MIHKYHIKVSIGWVCVIKLVVELNVEQDRWMIASADTNNQQRPLYCVLPKINPVRITVQARALKITLISDMTSLLQGFFFADNFFVDYTNCLLVQIRIINFFVG